MTFKHTKFEDSSTMRSLVKVAQEKGWVKEEPLQKTAAPKLDLVPSKSFVENLLKLCAGLRATGFEKQADELEVRFIQFKQANSLYDVGNEKGEDLIHAAHPKGSHKMENLDSKEATFEDILDKHLQMLNVVNSKPTGKLSNANQILGAVKNVLAQSANVQELLQSAYGSAYEAYQLASKAGGLTNMVLNWTAARLAIIKAAVDKSPQELTLNDVDDASSAISAMQRNLHPNALHNFLPDFLNKGISDDSVWDQINAKLETAAKAVSTAASLVKTQALTGKTDEPVASAPVQMHETTVAASPVVSKLVALINKLNAYSTVGSIARNRDAKKWIADEIGEIKDVMTRFNNIPEGQEDTVKGSFDKEVAAKESEVSQFASTWLGQA